MLSSSSSSSFRLLHKALSRTSPAAPSTAFFRALSTRVQESFPVSAYFVEDYGHRVVLCSDYQDDMELAAPWLWSNDSKWVHPTSGQRLKTPADYPGSKIINARLMSPDGIDIQDKLLVPPPKGSCHPTGVVYKSNSLPEEDDDWLLEIQWEDSSEPSHYFLSWLLEHATPKQTSRISKQHALSRDQELIEVDYATLLSDDDDKTVLFDLYDAIFKHGAAVVRNCPNISDCDESTPSAVVGRLLAGALSHGTLYGDVFHVKAMPLAHNVAYTTIGLSPHQDLAYYESPPGLQLLHCVAQKGILGGESTLVDGMAAAQHLRHLAPDLFETLCTTDATFCKQREGADMVSYYPHIQTTASSNSNNVIGINWSPPFEGPLRDMSKANDYYTAYAAFARLVDKDMPEQQHHHALSPQLCRALKEYAEHHTYERLLQEGDMLIFNNRRLLHGRKKFAYCASAKSERHLVGAYTNLDETLNQYRLLMRDMGAWKGDDLLNAGNGTTA